MQKINHKIGLILNDDTPETPLKKRIGFFILFLILVSSFEVILETVVSLNVKYYHHFFIIDTAVSILFSIEYILRLWTYRIDGEKPTISQRISNITSFYMVIDLISIIPFYLSLFIPTGYGFIRIVRILRLFRLLKFGRYMKSQNLVFNAIKNKGKELILSMQLVVFLTVILSALLYHIENSVQPDNFGDIIDAFVWSLSKFIGGVGGYGNFEPITLWGQVIATIVGLLGIALFAVPAGIIGAGFVEEIEAIKADEELKEKNNLLFKTFNFDHLTIHKKEKNKVGLTNIRRKILKEIDVERRLLLDKKDLLWIAREGKGIKLRTYPENGVDIPIVEAFEENSIYGTLINRQSKLTIVSPASCNQAFLGHFTYALSEYLEANYISNEKVASTNFLSKYQVSLINSTDYINEEKSKNIYIEQFKKDLLSTIKSNDTMIYFNISNPKNGSFHVLNGGEKGIDQFTQTESTFKNLEKLDRFYNLFKNSLKENDSIKKRKFYSVSKHKYYGNNNKKGFQWMIHEKRNAEVVYIYVSKEIINSEPDYYYPIIKVLGDCIKDIFN